MNCEQVQERLSRFHDGELAQAERAAVELHLGSCAVCPGELAAIAELSELARASRAPEPPADLWDRIQLQLARPDRTWFAAAKRIVPAWRVAALAALVLMAVASTWWASRARKQDRSPGAAEKTGIEENGPLLDQLLAAHAGEPVSLQEAARRVDFRVPAAPQLPEDYQLKDCCLCRDGCCDLVQCHFLCGSDRVVLVLGGSDHPMRYGARPVLETRVNGKPARVVQCECGLACSWQCQGTALTLIGPRDLSKLVQLVAFVSERLENRPVMNQ